MHQVERDAAGQLQRQRRRELDKAVAKVGREHVLYIYITSTKKQVLPGQQRVSHLGSKYEFATMGRITKVGASTVRSTQVLQCLLVFGDLFDALAFLAVPLVLVIIVVR
jgi:hypothetical protein